MLNCLVCIEDTILKSRVQTVLYDDDRIKFHYTDNCDDAVMIIESETIDLAVLSLSIPIMNGNELADMVIAHNPSARFCFLYDDLDIELAIEMFNQYEDTGIFENKIFLPADIKNKLYLQIKELSADSELEAQNEAFRKKEKQYKKAMNEMSSLLNSRIESYSQINRVYSKSIEYLCNDFCDEERRAISDFANCMFGQYVQDTLVDKCNITDVIKDLNDSLNDAGSQKHFQFISDIKTEDDEVVENICFVSRYLSHLYANYLERYRIKMELKEGDKSYRLDFLVDTRLGKLSERFLTTVYDVIKSSISAICYRIDAGHKEGIMQYRMFFVKKSVLDSQNVQN